MVSMDENFGTDVDGVQLIYLMDFLLNQEMEEFSRHQDRNYGSIRNFLTENWR